MDLIGAPGPDVVDAFVGIDLGTSGVRALAIDRAGASLGTAHRSFATLRPARDQAEQAPEAWWSATCEALREVLASGPLVGRRVRAVSLAGQMHGLVLLDKAGLPVRPAITWLDGRCRAELRAWREALGEGVVERIAGLPLSPGMLGPTLSWVARHEPSAYERARVALLPKDYLGVRLTGVACTDPSDATGTLLFDTAARAWSSRIVEAVGIRETLLPEVVETFDVRGTLTREAADATGLPAGIPVICGGGDTAMAALALDLAPGRVSLAVNTGGTVTTVAESARMRPEVGLHTMCHVWPGQWLLMQPLLAAGEALVWFAGIAGGLGDAAAVGDAAAAGNATGAGIDALLAEAAGLLPAAGDPIFLPTLAGERTDPQRSGAFVGLRLSHSRANLTRAVLEGVAFELRTALETVLASGAQAGGAQAGDMTAASEIICSGGGFRSPLWRQIQADVLGRPLTVIEEDQHSARGAAWAAARGVIGKELLPPRLTGRLQAPNDRSRAIYEDAYARFRQAYAATRAISHVLAGSPAD